MDLGIQIDLLAADGLERIGQGGDDRANILYVLGSSAYYLAGSEYEKSSFRGLDSVDETRELLLDATTFTISIVDFICTYISKPLFI